MTAWTRTLLRSLLIAAGVAAPVLADASDPIPPTTGSPMVEITKRCPSLRYVGREATFEITVTNRGTGPASNVVVADALPAGAQFLNADNGGQLQGNLVVWTLGSLAAGQTRTMKVNMRCNQITTLRNAARVTYCAEAVAVCETQVKGIPAILLECVDDPDPIEVGREMTYTITVTNQGSQVGTNVVIECTLPKEQEFVRAGGATNATNDGKTVRFAPLASLPAKGRASFTVTIKGIMAGDSRFAVSMKSDQIETTVNETESTNIYE